MRTKNQNQTKNLNNSLLLINRLNKSKNIVLKKINSTQIVVPARIIKKNHAFRISSSKVSETEIFFSKNKIKVIHATWAKRQLVFEFLYVNQLIGNRLEAEAGIVRDRNFLDKKKQYQRLIIPNEDKISFLKFVEDKIYESETLGGRRCICANFTNFSLDIYCYTGLNGVSFLVVDSDSKINHNDFSEAAFSTLVTLGYLSGNLVQNEGFYFTYSDKKMDIPINFKFTNLRPSISSIFHPINSNPSSFGEKGKNGDILYKKLKPISTREFSKLCKLVLQKHDLRAALLFMMETLKGSTFTMATGMVVILETLTHLYSITIPKITNSFKEPKLAPKILNKLRQIITENIDEIGEGSKKFLMKINQLNQIPNTTKLSKTFEDLGFKLNEEDKKVIARRNDLLHGRLTLDYGDDYASADMEMYLIATKVYTLVNILILKQVDFSGYIVNWPVVNKHVHKIKLKENVFRKI